MIKMSELRIGNYFLNPKGEIEQVEGLLSSMQGEFINPVMDYSIEQLTGYKEEECNPIRSTLKILEQLGFVRKECRGELPQQNDVWYELNGAVIDENGFPLARNVAIFATYEPYGKKLNYIHQFQNWYFALTAKELILNNPHHDTL